MSKRIPVKVLAKRCGISRSWLYKQLKSAGTEIVTEEIKDGRAMLGNGTVSVADAKRWEKRYAKARRLAAASKT